MHGKKLTIHLANGTPSGIRHVEIANWSGQAIACPRTKLNDLKEWPEANRPGVYILFEKNSGEAGDKAYVGESENVNRRLKDHLREKDFWNEVVFFTSKDSNLTKSHIMFLESRISELSVEAKRFEVEAGKTATVPVLPRSDQDAMEEFLINVKTVLGVLGHPILETVLPKDEGVGKKKKELTDIIFQFNIKGLKAEGRFSDEGFVLHIISEVSGTTSESIPSKVKALREAWIEKGTLEKKKDGNNYYLRSTQLVSSSSFAAALVAGTSRSGPQSWVDESGRTLKEIEAEFAEGT